uniref:Glycosyl transferase family 2 n=1 Tax=Pithovirus LCPAC401 TaxID=2506595 RepID=A0A481ZA83_9VIRU|nr:MAG: glycosyl transferase family 2 [Pithovirus LCPAC401]
MDEITKIIRSVNETVEREREEVIICVVIICRQEEKIIKRCLDSTISVGNYWCICDTGSTDNTVEVVEDWFDENKVDGQICNHKWVDFGHNRTLAIKTAEYHYPNSTYHLHIDCDMILKVGKMFNKNTLFYDSYSFEQTNGDLTYRNIRLTKVSLNWKSLGVTHEYYHSSTSKESKSLHRNMIWIDDMDDGGSKDDKFIRDYNLLIGGIRAEPDNVRYVFYMAQTLMALERWDNAIRYYTKRIEMGGYHEEIYYSYYKRGECYEKLDKWNDALSSYLQAYNHTPTRSESLYEIVYYYRNESDHHLAALFCKIAMKIKRPEDLHLFILDTVYDHLLEYEYSIIAFYVDDIKGGIKSSERVLNSNAPNYIKKMVSINMEFYR